MLSRSKNYQKKKKKGNLDHALYSLKLRFVTVPPPTLVVIVFFFFGNF